jgi:hypothetical protein
MSKRCGHFGRILLVALLGGALAPIPWDLAGAGRRRGAEIPPYAEHPDTVWIWISPAEIAALPDSGPAWDAILADADAALYAPPDLGDERDRTALQLLAKAYAYQRTGIGRYRNTVISKVVNSMGTEDTGRTLGLGRNLLATLIAAQLVGLEMTPWGPAFRDWLDAVRTEELLDGRNLIETHEERPNNWGTYAGASRMAAALYLRDFDEFDGALRVFRGYLGDRSAWAGFSYGADLSWHANPALPVPINPPGAMLLGHPVDGVLPDDQRRAGPFQWPPPVSNYPYGALQGAVAQALIAHRQGVPAWQLYDSALVRALRWLEDEMDSPLQGDDAWVGHVVNHFCGTDFPAPVPAQPGKNMGWTDWTHPSP